MKVVIFYSIMIFAFFTVSHGFAELYQYKDSEGVTHYTDNFGSIPESRRDKVKVHSEIKGVSAVEKDKDSSNSGQKDNKDPVAGKAQTRAEKNKNDLSQKRQHLIDQRKELNEEYKKLEQERERLRNNSPDRSASDDQKKEYSKKVKALNDKIEAYDKKAKAFEKQVEAFNSKVDNQ